MCGFRTNPIGPAPAVAPFPGTMWEASPHPGMHPNNREFLLVLEATAPVRTRDMASSVPHPPQTGD